jgi:GT2 family glycosyltransferase
VSDAETSIAVVVLNWNGLSDTLACLESLGRSTVPLTSIVVDNGSSGSDVEVLRTSGLAGVVIETGTNLGYAEGNNVGLRYALRRGHHFRTIGVLNNDTTVQPSAFEVLARQLNHPHQTRRALTPTIVRQDDPTTIWFAGGVIDKGWPRHLQPHELSDAEPLRPSEWLTGCCIVARSDTWRYVGPFDPRYYLIFEDCDWSLRARQLGVELAVSSGARIEHKISQSLTSPQAARLGSYYYVRNGLRFEWEYFRLHLLHFVVEQVVRPTVSAARRLNWRPGLLFRWCGLLGFVTRQTGMAPLYVQRLACRRTTIRR